MGQKIWTASELERMTSQEQDDLFERSIVRDLNEVPADFLDRVMARAKEHIAKTETRS